MNNILTLFVFSSALFHHRKVVSFHYRRTKHLLCTILDLNFADLTFLTFLIVLIVFMIFLPPPELSQRLSYFPTFAALTIFVVGQGATKTIVVFVLAVIA